MIVEVEDLYHSYPGSSTNAVDGLTFSIAEGEIFGFLGPNGAGKSTTQNILTGILPLQKGEAKVVGHDIRRPTRDLFNLIGVSFENANLYGKLTGLENLRFFASMYDVSTEDAMQLLRQVGLEEAANKRAGAYSKGMQQRLTFARSMLNRPKMWFVDEPTAGLDPAFAQVVKDIILERREDGATVLLTTHNMHIAEELCDRVAFLNEGRIAALDTPRNLKMKYGQSLVRVEHRTNGQLKQDVLSLAEETDRQELQRLIADGHIETLHTQEATLEEVFIKVTGRGLE